MFLVSMRNLLINHGKNYKYLTYLLLKLISREILSFHSLFGNKCLNFHLRKDNSRLTVGFVVTFKCLMILY